MILSKKSRLKKIIEQKSIILGSKEKIVSTRGTPSKWLLDLRTTFMDSEGLDLVAQLFWEQHKSKLPFQVGGLESGSVPLIAAIILEGRKRGIPVNGFFVRKERKNYGRQHLIEGKVTKDPIIVVDDLMNSGGTLEKVRLAVADIGKSLQEVFVVVNYEAPRGKEYLKENSIKITSIFKRKEFKQLVSRALPEEKPLPNRFQFLWRWQPLEHGYFYVVPKSSPAIDSERVFFGTDTGAMMALDQKTGQEVWKFQTGRHVKNKGIFSSPAVCRGRVYFGSYDGGVYCLDTKTGKEIWHLAEADWVGSSPAIAEKLGLLFIGLEHTIRGRQGSIVALDMKTGAKVWEYTVREWLHGSPAFCPEKSLVAIGTNDSTGLLFDAATGRKIWEIQFGGPVKYRPTFDLRRNTVIFGSHDGKVYFVDIKTGKEIWSLQTEDIIYSEPLIAGDKAFVTSTDKKIYILDLVKKKLRNVLQTNGRIFASPRMFDGKIYIGSNNGFIYQIDPKNEKITGKAQFPERMTNAIAYSLKNKVFYALSYDNQLFAFKKLKK